jgi:hypothetical protein
MLEEFASIVYSNWCSFHILCYVKTSFLSRFKYNSRKAFPINFFSYQRLFLDSVKESLLDSIEGQEISIPEKS